MRKAGARGGDSSTSPACQLTCLCSPHPAPPPPPATWPLDLTRPGSYKDFILCCCCLLCTSPASLSKASVTSKVTLPRLPPLTLLSVAATLPPPPPPPLTHVTGWGSGPGILSRSQGGDQPRSLPARNSPILAALTNALLGKGQQSDLGSLDQKLRFVSLASPCGVTIPTKVKFNPPEAFCWKTENSQPNAVPLLRSVPSLCGLVLLSELLLLPLWTL